MTSRFQPATSPLRPSRPTLAVTAILVAVAVNLTLLGVLRLLQRNAPVTATEPTYDLTVLDLVELPQPVEPPSLAREPVPSTSEAAAAAAEAGSEAAPAVPALPTPALPAPPAPAPQPIALDLPTAALPLDLQALAPLPPREPPPVETPPTTIAPESTPPSTDIASAPTTATPPSASPAPTASLPSTAQALPQALQQPGADAGTGEFGTSRNPGAAATGAGDADPTVLHRVDPRYPESARRQGVEGEVTVHFIVTETGQVRDATVVHASSRRFERAALSAVAQWQFSPGKRGGVSAPSQCEITFRFRLDQ